MMGSLPKRTRRAALVGTTLVVAVASLSIAPAHGLNNAATVATLAGGGADLQAPQDVIWGPDGMAYIADTGNDRVRRVAPDGTITTVVGTGVGGYSGDGGPADSAQIDAPSSLAFDSAGNLFVADTGNHRIRRVSPDGVITTVVGTGVGGFAGNGGPAPEAQVNFPTVVEIDPTGRLLFADTWSYQVRAVEANGTVSVFAGTGSFGNSVDGELAAETPIGLINDITFDTAGNAYLSGQARSMIWRIDPDGVIGHFAGLGDRGPFVGDGGPATQARLAAPHGLTVDDAGNLIFADKIHNRLRMIDTAGVISTIAGTGERAFGADGASPLVTPIDHPSGLDVGPDGSLLVAEGPQNRVRKIDDFSDGRPIVSYYSEQDKSNLDAASAYLDLTPDEFQRTGVAVLRFINALAGNTGPAPLGVYAPSEQGTVAVVSVWPTAEQETLTWVDAYYVTRESVSQKVGVTLLYFLASIDARNHGTPLPIG